jgi:hypothetical protein
LKSEKENIYNEYLNIKKDFEENLRQQGSIVNEHIDKYKQENYKYKCLYEEVKGKFEAANEKNKDLLKKNEEISHKFERLKEKNSEKENLYIKMSLEKNMIDSKIEKLSKEVLIN